MYQWTNQERDACLRGAIRLSIIGRKFNAVFVPRNDRDVYSCIVIDEQNTQRLPGARPGWVSLRPNKLLVPSLKLNESLKAGPVICLSFSPCFCLRFDSVWS